MLFCLRAPVAGTGADILSTFAQEDDEKIGRRKGESAFVVVRHAGVGVQERSYNEYQHELFSNPS